jgi:hypothetical protein
MVPIMARLRVSIVFESGTRIGPGKARLLESIRGIGSISGAAREMGVSTSAPACCLTVYTTFKLYCQYGKMWYDTYIDETIQT